MSTEFDQRNQENSNQNREEEKESLIAQCREYLQQPVRLQTNDGGYYEGVIEHVDNEYVYLITTVSEGSTEFRGGESRQRPPYGYGFPYGPGYGGYYGSGYGAYYGGYPFYGPYGYGYFGYPGRISRLVLPLAALTAISLLPYY